MKKFSIDLKASEKGERKKAVKYLRSKGFDFADSDRWKNRPELDKWYYLSCGDEGFRYCHEIEAKMPILTLPRDCDKLVEIVEEKTIAEQVGDHAMDSLRYAMGSDLFGSLPSMPICPLPFFDCSGITHRPDSEEQQIKNLKAENKRLINLNANIMVQKGLSIVSAARAEKKLAEIKKIL